MNLCASKIINLASAPDIQDVRELLALCFVVKNKFQIVRTNGRHPVDAGSRDSNILDAQNIRGALINCKRISKDPRTALGVGILTGARNDLVVIDCDNHNNSCAGIDNLARKLKLSKEAILSLAFSVKSPSGGYHLYFKCKNADNVQSTVGVIAPDVDVRAKGGLIIGSYSYRNQSVGKEPGWYTPFCDPVLNASKYQEFAKCFNGHFGAKAFNYLSELFPSLQREIPEIPKAIYDILPKVEKKKNIYKATSFERTFLSSHTHKYSDALRAIEQSQQGARNAVLYKKAFYLFKNWCNAPNIESDLLNAGLSAGLSHCECIATIRSAKNDAKEAV